jgi:flagellar hook-length control protein FliK
VIVSLPQIAVNVAPVKAPVSAPSTPAQFSAALSQASDNTAGSSAMPKVMSKPSSGGRAASSKDNDKSSAKVQSSSTKESAASQSPSLYLPSDNIAKIPANPYFSAFLSLLADPTADEANEADTNGDSVSATNVSSATPGKSNFMPFTTAWAVPLSSAPAASANSGSSESPKAVSKQADVPAQAPNAELAVSSLAIAAGAGKSAQSSNVMNAKSGAESKISVSQSPKGGTNNSVNPGAPASKPATTESKQPAHDVQSASNVDEKNATSASSKHPSVIASAIPVSVAPTPSLQPMDVKPASAQDGQANNSATAKTNTDTMSASQTNSKKDESSSQNANAQSQKNDSSASITAATIKQTVSDGQTQTSTVSPSSNAGPAQVTQLVSDVKTIASSGSFKAAETTAKNPGQPPASVADTETAVEAAAHLASPIQVAKLMERAGEAELRVGIQAGEFGNVDIRTSMGRSQFTAEISVERGELGRAMSAELPSLQHRLAEQRVPPANIILQNNNLGSGSSDLRQGTRQHQYAATPLPAIAADDADSNPPLIAMEAMESSTGLDIHI